jgi:hypothetical protein
MSLAFMNHKSFHPSSKANQRKIWIAQQKAQETAKKEKERKKQLDQEHQFYQNKSSLQLDSDCDDLFQGVWLKCQKKRERKQRPTLH